MYSSENGVILEMSQYPKVRPKFIDCSIFGAHGYEHELLFMGGDKSMDIQSIRLMKHNEDHKCFIKAMRVFNKLTTAVILSKLERWEMSDSDSVMIQRLIECENSFPEYIRLSFRQFCSEKRRVRMDCYCLRDCRFYQKFESLFMHKYHDNLLQFDALCSLFPNATIIESWDTGEVTSLYLTALKNILNTVNAMGDATKLKKVVIHCDPMENSTMFNAHRRRFRDQGWTLRKMEDWELLIQRMK